MSIAEKILRLIRGEAHRDNVSASFNPAASAEDPIKLSDTINILVGSKPDEGVKIASYKSKERMDSIIRIDRLFERSPEYKDYRLASTRTRLKLQDKYNLIMQNEMISRNKTIGGILTILQSVHDRCDLDGNIKICLDLLKDSPGTIRFLTNPIPGDRSSGVICPITCKISDALDLHTFEEFRKVCKLFIQDIFAANPQHVAYIDLIGNPKTQEYKLCLQLAPGEVFFDAMMKFQPTTYYQFIEQTVDLSSFK